MPWRRICGGVGGFGIIGGEIRPVGIGSEIGVSIGTGLKSTLFCILKVEEDRLLNDWLSESRCIGLGLGETSFLESGSVFLPENGGIGLISIF